jgi:tol-pal system-associated acyl-CoA thioesterase
VAVDHRVSYKVYYEDTDSLGIVYYANYLKYMERGRTEFLAARGKPVQQWNAEGVLIVVHSVNLVYRRAAALGDVLDVVSRFTVDSRFRGTFHQRIERGGDLIVDGRVEVVCLDADQQLRSFPDGLRDLGD